MKMDLTSVSNFIEKLEKLSFVRKLYRPSGFRMAEGTKIIAIFCHTLKEGGSQRAVESLIEKIEKLGFSICVFSPEDGKYASIYTDKYKTYTIVSDMGISLHGYERDMLQGFAAVFINSICSSRYMMYFCNTKTPCFIWVHEGEEVLRNWLRSFDPILIRSNNFIFLFPWKSAMMLFEKEFQGAHIRYLPIDVNVELTKKNNEKNECIKFFIPGSYQIHKGFHIAVQSFMYMQKMGLKDYKALFCGYNAEGEYYKVLLNATSIYENIELIGEISKSEMYRQLSMADCVVIPSLFDAGPLTAVEALALKKPVIISDAAGVSSYLTDCYNGFVFPNENVDELLKKLLFVYHERGKLEDLAERGYAVYEQNFTYNSMNKYLTEILTDYFNI